MYWFKQAVCESYRGRGISYSDIYDMALKVHRLIGPAVSDRNTIHSYIFIDSFPLQWREVVNIYSAVCRTGVGGFYSALWCFATRCARMYRACVKQSDNIFTIFNDPINGVMLGIPHWQNSRPHGAGTLVYASSSVSVLHHELNPTDLIQPENFAKNQSASSKV